MRWINSEFPAWPVCCVLRQMEAEGAWFLTKAACENLMDAQINTQRRQVAIQRLRCYNYSSFSLLNKHKGGFFFCFFLFILLPASYPFPLTAQIGNLALIAPNTLLRHNKCLSAWCNCVCRSWRAMEERELKVVLVGRRLMMVRQCTLVDRMWNFRTICAIKSV